MSAPSRSERLVRIKTLLLNPSIQLGLFACCAPLLVLLIQRFFAEPRGLFQFGFFALGAATELALDAWLVARFQSGRMSRRRFLLLQYLNRTVVGLPLTVYLAAAHRYGFIALLRFLPAVYGLAVAGPRLRAGWFAAFFAFGVIAYRILRDVSPPGEREIVIVLASLALAFLILAYDSRRRDAERQMLTRRRADLRVRRERDHIRARETRLLQALLPPPSIERFQKDRPLRPESGYFAALGFYFPELNERAGDFAREGERLSSADSVQELQREWNLFSEYFRTRMLECELIPLSGAASITGVRLLESNVPTDREALRSLLFRERRLLFQLYFEGLRLRDFCLRTRRQLEQRGRRGWFCRGALAAGEAALMQTGGENPAPALRGALALELKRRLAHDAPINQTTFMKDERRISQEDSFLIQPTLIDIFAPYFVEAQARYDQAWLAPGQLRPQYAKDESGSEAAPDFFERLLQE